MGEHLGGLRQGLSKQGNRERARILSKRAHRTTRRVAPCLTEQAATVRWIRIGSEIAL